MAYFKSGHLPLLLPTLLILIFLKSTPHKATGCYNVQDLQLRRLARRHRKLSPLPRKHSPPRRQPALRRDLLWPPDRPVQRRPPRHRLHRCQNLISSRTGIMDTSLFMVGEIGGNDYNHPFESEQLTVNEVRSFVPFVVDTIASTIHDLIKLGAKTLVVPGVLPNGCVPVFLTTFRSQNYKAYDPQTGCIRWINEFFEYHNRVLVEKLNTLRKLHPHVTIIYADYYGALMNIFQFPSQLGFDEPLLACCGSHCPYDCSIRCGNEGSTVCADPSTFASWDGMHLTEAAYEVVANGVLRGSYAVPAIEETCADIEHRSA